MNYLCDSLGRCVDGKKPAGEGQGSDQALIRLFVACRFAKEVQSALQGFQAGCPGMRWMLPETLHVTLRFLGKIPFAMLQPVQDALKTVQAKSFVLTQGALGWFSHGRRHVLYAGVEECPELCALQAKVVQALGTVLPLSEKGFTPHITLGRALRGHNPEDAELASYKAAKDALPRLAVPVTSFSLIESHFTPECAVHAEVVSYPLI